MYNRRSSKFSEFQFECDLNDGITLENGYEFVKDKPKNSNNNTKQTNDLIGIDIIHQEIQKEKTNQSVQPKLETKNVLEEINFFDQHFDDSFEQQQSYNNNPYIQNQLNNQVNSFNNQNSQNNIFNSNNSDNNFNNNNNNQNFNKNNNNFNSQNNFNNNQNNFNNNQNFNNNNNQNNFNNNNNNQNSFNNINTFDFEQAPQSNNNNNVSFCFLLKN